MLPPPTFDISGLVVRPSPGKGNGLFTTRDVPANTKLCDYKGIDKPYEHRRQYYYSMRRIKRILDGTDYLTENPSHYCNESLTPNVVLKKKALYSLRDLKQDEELFLQYPKQYPRDYTL